MALQKKKDAATNGATYTYDPRGWLATRTWARPGSISAAYSHNLLGELTGINYSDSTPDVTISPDNKGRVIGVTDGAGSWSYQYDANDRLEREANVASGNALIYGRDGNGRRTGYSYWDGAAASWATWGGWGFDTATGRLSGVETPEGWISQGYEANTGRIGSTVVNGWMLEAIQTWRSYDGLGRLTQIGTLAAGDLPSPLAKTPISSFRS